MDAKRSCCCGALPRTWRWLLSLLGLPLIFLLMLGLKQGNIENDLASRSTAELKAAGMDGVRVEATGRGRDLLLRGNAESAEVRDKAIQLVQNVYGVREVQSLIQVAASAESAEAAVMTGENGTAISAKPASGNKQDGSAGSGQSSASGISGSGQTTLDVVQDKQAATTSGDSYQVKEQEEAAQNCQQQLDEAMRGKTILFATNQANIEQDSIGLLESLTGILSPCQTMISGRVLEIGGHTDNVGNDAYNQRLSQQRADTVREYFIQQGIDGALLRSKGYGNSQPVASNDTAEDRAKNRRITFEISPE